MVRYFLSLIVLLVSVAFGLTYNQPGYIYNGLGQPIEGVLVTDNEPRNPDSCRPCNSAYTNDTGKYIIKIPDPWYYFNSITFTKEFYVTKSVNTYTFHIRDTLEQNDTVNLSSTSYVYDGFPKAVTVTSTTPTAGLSVNILYDTITSTSHFSSTAPINAGSYAVRCSVTTRHYHGVDTKILVIQPKPVTVREMSVENKIYDGTDTATVSGGTLQDTVGSDAIGFTVSANFSDANAGNGKTVTIITTLTGPKSVNYSISPITLHADITKATAHIFLKNLNQTYDGSQKQAGDSTYPQVQRVDFSYGASAPTDAGKYVVTATVNDPNYQGSVSDTLIILPKIITAVNLSVADKQYDGNDSAKVSWDSLSGVVNNDDVILIPTGTFNNMMLGTEKPVIIILTLSGTKAVNYSIVSPITLTADITPPVSKITAKVSLSSRDTTIAFDGTSKNITAITDPPGRTVVITYNGISNPPINVGTYIVVATINDLIYQGSDSGKLVIVDNRPPEVTITSPKNGDILLVPSTRTLTWRASDNVGIASRVILASSDNVTWTIDSVAGNSGTKSWNLPANDTCKIFVRVKVYDASGNSAVSDVKFFGVNKPIFTSPNNDTAIVGKAFSYTILCEIPGNPPTHKVTILSKPNWLKVRGDTLLYADTVPKGSKDTVVKVEVSAGDASNTLVLTLHIKSPSTGTHLNRVSLKSNPYQVELYTVNGARIQKTTTQSLKCIFKTPAGFCGMKVTQNGRTVIKKTILLH